ncbi:hypothetical protein [Flavobacterium sp.]|uniref:hypothetical protein n=1 Tax=Flavobacterium sp. TaxID=239 RepID=UPI003D6BF50C
MKKLLLFLFILGYSATYSQSVKEKPLKNKDSIVLQKTDKALSNKDFNAIIQTSFSKLITGQTANNVGSYAGVDIEKTEVTFSPTFILENGNIITGKMMGGISDGTYAIFNNSKLNTNISLEVQYHFLYKKTPRTIYYYQSDYDKYLEDSTKIVKDHSAAKAKILKSFENNERIIENDKLNTENKTLDADIATLNQKLNTPLTADEKELFTAQVDNKIFKKNQNAAKIAENKLLNKDYNKLKELLKINNTRADKLNENDISKLKVAGYQFSWFSLAYKLKNDEFRLLDPKEIYENQITKDNYISHEFKTQYSYVNLNQTNYKTTYFTSSLTMKYKSNFNDLKKVEVTQTSTIGTSSNQIREISDKFFAYSGTYKTGVTELNVDVDFYHFPFSRSAIGFHIFPKSKYTQNIKPVYNAGFGVVFPFIDKKKDKSTINAELYYNFTNIFNSNDVDYTLIERNNIGIRLVFPINFNPN